MIPAQSAPAQPAPPPQNGLIVAPQPAADWRHAWRDAIRDPVASLELLGLPHLAARLSADAHAQFPLRVPRGFALGMRYADPTDPLLRQVLPLDDEDRIDDALLDWLRGLPWPVSIVIHANHANEIDEGVVLALRRLRGTGAVLLKKLTMDAPASCIQSYSRSCRDTSCPDWCAR